MAYDDNIGESFSREIQEFRKFSLDVLKKSEERLRFALQGASELIWDWNLITDEIIISPRLEEYLGYGPQDAGTPKESRSWLKEHIHPEHARKFESVLRDYVEGKKERFELEFCLKDVEGRWRWFWSRGKCVARDSDGNPIRMVGIQTDITERKSQEEDLRQTIEDLEAKISLTVDELEGVREKLDNEVQRRETVEQLLTEHEAMRQLADEAMEFIFILDSELNLKYVNEFGARFLGKNPVDIVGTSLRTVFPPDAVDFQLNAVRKVFESGESLLVEDSASFASGDIYLETRLIPMKREGAVFSVLGVSRNITERKQMESALRESEERYRAFIHAVPYGIQITDAEGKITFSNPAHHRMLGYLEGELPGKHIWDFIDDVQERESLRAYYKTIISSQPVPSPAFQSNVTKDGRRINVRVDWDYMRNQDNEVTGICSVVSDITELQRAEDALRGSEERLRLLTDSLPVLISYIDTEQRLRFVNKHFEMWGHRSVLIGRKVRDVFGDSSYTAVRDSIETVLSGTQARCQVWMDYPELGRRYIDVTFIPDRHGMGSVKGCYALMSDITDLETVETKLRIRDKAISTSVNAVVFTDMNGDITYVNDAVLSLWGFSYEDVIGKKILDFAFDPAQAADILNTVLSRGEWSGEIVTKKKDGSLLYVYLSANSVLDDENTPLCLMASFIDITEQKRVRDELQVKDMAIASSINAVVFTDLKGVITYVNDAFQNLWGYQGKEVLGKAIVEIANNPALAGRVIDEVREQGAWSGEVVSKRKDGSLIDVLVSAHSVRDSAGRPVCLMSSFLDITERKEAEKELARAKDRLQALYDASPDMIFIHGSDGRLLDVNDNVTKIYGYSREEMLTLDPGELMGEGHTPEMAFERLRRAMNGESLTFDWVARNKKGDEFPVEVRLQRVESLYPGTENDVCVLAVVRDISDRRKFEVALRESEERYRALFESDVVGVAILDRDGVIIRANEEFQRMVGYDETELAGLGVRGITHPDDLEKNLVYLSDMLEGERKVYRLEKRYLRKDGSVMWGDLSVFGIFDALDRFRYCFATVVDISQRKKAESELSITRFSMDHASDAICLMDPDGSYVYVNEAASGMLGFSREELLSMKLFDIDVFAREQDWPYQWKTLHEGKTFTVETLYRARNGRQIPVEMNANYLEYDGREYNCVFARDISWRKKMEAELIKSEKRYRAIVEDQAELLCRFRPDGKVTFVNEANCRYFNRERHELEGTEFMPLVHPDDRDILKAKIASLSFENPTITCEHRVVLPDTQEERWMQWTNRAIFDEDGAINEYQAVGRDITLQKQNEIALAESEKKFREFAELLPQIVFETDEKGIFTFVNKRALEMTGYTEEDIQAGLYCVNTLIPEDRELALQNMLRVLKGELPGGTEYTMMRKDGEPFPVMIYSSRIMRGDTVCGMRGIVADITSVKQAEREKSRLVEELQDALSNVKMMSGLLPICTSCKKIKDEDGKWTKLEGYLSDHSEASFSYHACPDCAARLYPEGSEGDKMVHPLTAREKEVLGWIRQGKSNWEIAAILGISERTVKYHVSGILQKLDVVTRAQAVSVALGMGIIED